MPAIALTWRDRLRYRSENLVSLMLSHLSENKNLLRVFKVLFSSEGSGIYIRPMTDKGYGVSVNPKKSDKHTLAENDQIVVLAED